MSKPLGVGAGQIEAHDRMENGSQYAFSFNAQPERERKRKLR
jgi:hypothetical protein